MIIVIVDVEELFSQLTLEISRMVLDVRRIDPIYFHFSSNEICAVAPNDRTRRKEGCETLDQEPLGFYIIGISHEASVRIAALSRPPDCVKHIYSY